MNDLSAADLTRVVLNQSGTDFLFNSSGYRVLRAPGGAGCAQDELEAGAADPSVVLPAKTTLGENASKPRGDDCGPYDLPQEREISTLNTDDLIPGEGDDDTTKLGER